MVNEVIDYEVINQAKKVLITYSLEDLNLAEEHERVFVIAKEKDNKKFDLIVSSEFGDDLFVLKDMDKDILLKIERKEIILAGISEKTNEIEDVMSVSNMSVEKPKKMKFGG